ncbi:hypothetical protein BGZ63DRAFT_382266 [Mariannaea sp. PMI_226]|nr:hypothetical protein BGZ63DRAFT_382266 [Mariannaea sp. PMI_226]
MRLTPRIGPRNSLLKCSHLQESIPATIGGTRRFISKSTTGNSNSETDNSSNKSTEANAKIIYPSAPSKDHADLATFLAYVKRTKLNRNSSVYKGTHYEYTVAQALSSYGFHLHRVGGASDRGLDLLGTWAVPTISRAARIVVQCKAGSRSPSPMYVRELKGSMAEAPPGWRGNGNNGGHDDVLGLLVGEKPATRGVLEELRTTVGLGYVCCSREGEVMQLLWNQKAQEIGLEGITVGVKYSGDGLTKRLVLMKDGKVLLPLLDRKN